jgi:RNA polymerase sigma factor (sigma-70 family)
LNDDIFTQALVRLAEPLRRRAYRLTHNQSEADDLLQETMTRAWSARFSFRAGSSLQAWTFTILRNLFLTRLRRSRHMVNLDDLAERLVAADANQHEVAELGEVMAAISRLPPDQRSALSAVSLEGFDYATAAEKLNLTQAALKSRVRRARAALVQLVEEGLPKASPVIAGASHLRGAWAAAKASKRPLWIG